MSASTDDLQRRRLQLRDQLLVTGPEHCDMKWWLLASDGADLHLSDASTFDINACDTTACLAGHGALVMAREGVNVADHDNWAAVEQVARYYALDRDAFWQELWSRVNVGEFNLRDEYRRTGSEWEALIAYLDALLKGSE